MNKVSIVKYEKPGESVEKAIALSGALDRLKKGDKVFIKPNIVFWSRVVDMPPWGVITTTRVVEDVVKALRKRGAGEIIIGEGTVTTDPTDTLTSAHAFETLGYNKLAKTYDLTVKDIFDCEFKPVDLGDGLTLSFARELLEADLVVNLPVLKTHAQTRVSLGIKNLKGCIDKKGRKLCHSDNMIMDLDAHVAKLSTVVGNVCTIIDGIYTLEKGPGFSGNARRSNIIIASSDMVSADIVGAAALGFDPSEIGHIAIRCKERGMAPSVSSVELVGEPLENVASPHPWDFPYNEDNTLPANMVKRGVTGLSFPKYDHSMCTYCSAIVGLLQFAIGSAYKGKPFDNVQVLTGKMYAPDPYMNHTILMGKCQVKLNKNNPDIKNAIAVPGCPPNLDKLVEGVKKAGIPIDENIFKAFDMAPAMFMAKYAGKKEFTQDFYRIPE
ncbi:MAG: DUF362 domain-containing protein [Proteobacteria bacterium]|nr:DUF362 domain-containing protein [Pseudomonadota bacterium]